MLVLLKSFALCSAFIWLLQPQKATWRIGTLGWPRFYPNFESWWDISPFYMSWRAIVVGDAIVRNPNMLGSYMHGAELDIYVRMSPHRLRYLGTANASEAHIRGRSDTHISTVMEVDRVDLSLIADLVSTMSADGWRVPILALGTASVDSFTILTVGIKCVAVIDVNLFAMPYAQIYAQDKDACQFTYNLQVEEEGQRLPPKYLYDRLPRIPLLASFPVVDVISWI